jgi:predicted DNA-binding protein
VYNYTLKEIIMGTARLNITIPESLNNDINHYAEELGRKKSHIIAAALDMYFDYIDLKVAEKRLESDEPTYSLKEMKKELGL